MTRFLIPIFFLGFMLVRGAIDMWWGVFTLLGLFCVMIPKMRLQALSNIGGWTKTDTYLSLAIASVFIFKLISVLWSAYPKLAISNVIWHTYLTTWPLVFFAMSYCKPSLEKVLPFLAIGLIVVGAWDAFALMSGYPMYHKSQFFNTNAGILATVTLAAGSWMWILFIGSYKSMRKHRWLYALAVVAAWVILYSTGRRTEWFSFFVITALIGVWRIRYLLTWLRVLTLVFLLAWIAVGFVFLRYEQLTLAYYEVSQYFSPERATSTAAISTSVGARLEMYRLGVSAFLDHPIFGMSAGVRPNMLPQYGGGGAGGGLLPFRHFHSEFLQALVEGGVVWASVFTIAVVYFVRKLVIEPFKINGLASMLAFGLVISYAMVGLFNACLVYNQQTGTFVLFSSLLWFTIRHQSHELCVEKGSGNLVVK